MAEAEACRYRIRFAKGEAMRYTGQLDLHRTWERTVRRAGQPLAYTQGFKPRSRLNLGEALPLGVTSECELADIWLESQREAGDLLASLQAAAPPGLTFLSAAAVPAGEPALQGQILSGRYRVQLLQPAAMESLRRDIGELTRSREVIRQRRGRSYDLRPLIEALEACETPGMHPALEMRLSLREGATGRPDEVLFALSIDPAQTQIHRTALILAPGSFQPELVPAA
jgi:radical SAM-linked protein